MLSCLLLSHNYALRQTPILIRYVKVRLLGLNPKVGTAQLFLGYCVGYSTPAEMLRMLWRETMDTGGWRWLLRVGGGFPTRLLVQRSGSNWCLGQ